MNDLWDLALYEAIALLSLWILKLIVDYVRKEHYLKKAFTIITKRLDDGATDITGAVGGTYAELPISISMLSFFNKYLDYLTKNEKSNHITLVNEFRTKAFKFGKIRNVPYDMLCLIEKVEKIAKSDDRANISDWCETLLHSISERERLYSINKKLNTISIILGAIGVIGVVATFYFGLK